VTETVEFEDTEETHQIVRREAQALEAIAQQTSRRPRILRVSEAGKTFQLELTGNGLGSIPQELYQLSQLKELCLSHNPLTNLGGLLNLLQLQRLYLHYNQLKTLEGMPNLQQLKELMLYRNQLTSLEGMPNLQQLRELYLQYNLLTSLEGMPSLPKLQEIRLENNPKLNDPERIQALKDRGVKVYT